MQLEQSAERAADRSAGYGNRACSSNKNASNDQSGEGMLGAGTGMDGNANGGNMSSEEQARLQMQQLQQNNIVYFDLDNTISVLDFAAMLDAHANFLRSNPSYKVTVEGHADERGTPEYNIALGERRANAVKMYLQGKGVSADQISIVYGKENLQYNHDEAAYAKTVAPYWFTKENGMSSNSDIIC